METLGAVGLIRNIFMTIPIKVTDITNIIYHNVACQPWTNKLFGTVTGQAIQRAAQQFRGDELIKAADHNPVLFLADL